jgi:hypothetical protein
MAAMSDEVKALYVRRNALMHDAALTGQDRQGKWFIFRYDMEMPDPIKLAPDAWDGSSSMLDQDIYTYINPRVFTDKASEIMLNVLQRLQDRQQELKIE